MGGFFGVAAKEDCVFDLFFGTDYHSHLGTRRAGMAVYSKEEGYNRAIHNIENAPFRTKFDKDVNEMRGNLGIGCISDFEPQPLMVRSHHGTYAITTVGKINNTDAIIKDLFAKGHSHFLEMSGGDINATELVAAIVNQKDNLVEGIQYAQEIIEGSMTLLIMTPKGIYAARDKMGRTPVAVGKKEGAYCVSFESFAYLNLGYQAVRELGPGEIAVVTPEGVRTLVQPGKDMKICTFLWVYYGYPACEYEGKNVEEMRFHTGFEMGKKDDIEADFVSGIPDSGVGMALGYAVGKQIPYRRGIVKYTPTWPRSFTPSNQAMRELVAKMKLIPNKSMLDGKRVVFCDDSIVRGTQLRDNVSDLYRYGAKEVHMRISCPPLLYPCKFLNFTASKSEMELITRRTIAEIEGNPDKNVAAYARTGSPQYNCMVNCICKKLNFSSLIFNPLDTLVESIGLPKECICTHCFDGSSYE